MKLQATSKSKHRSHGLELIYKKIEILKSLGRLIEIHRQSRPEGGTTVIIDFHPK